MIASRSELARESTGVPRTIMLTLLFLAIPAQAEHLGRLFFTPDQRVMLENLKGRPQAAAQASETITVNGLVQRGDGKRTVWINGVPQESQADGGGRTRKPAPAASVPVVVPGSGKTLELKVGQTVEVRSGAVSETPPRAAPKAGAGEPLPHASPESQAER